MNLSASLASSGDCTKAPGSNEAGKVRLGGKYSHGSSVKGVYPNQKPWTGWRMPCPQTISFLFSKTSLNIYLSVTNESTELSHYIQFLKDSNAFALKVTCTEILREKSQGQIRQLVFECINKHFNLESICVKGDIHTVMCPLTFSGSSEIWLFCYQ